MLGKKILSTKNTPEIILNPEGIITIRGRSMNRNFDELKDELDDWIDKYITSPAEVTYVDFFLEYFNKANTKVIISLIKKIESLKLTGKKCIINWYYEEGDEDILEKGEYFSSELNIPFNFIEIYDELMPEYFPHELEIPV
jgi:SiaC family regulatory phosphoprotein